jgi:hypothetical protein
MAPRRWPGGRTTTYPTTEDLALAHRSLLDTAAVLADLDWTRAATILAERLPGTDRSTRMVG